MTESTKVPGEEIASNRARESIDTKYVERTGVGISLTVKLTRGTATRDQDRLIAKVKAKTLDEAHEEMEILRTYIHDLAEDVWQIHPEYESE